LYWDAVIPGAPAGKAAELRRRLNEAKLERVASRGNPDSAECEWFKLDYSGRRRDVQTLSGPWSAGIDPKKTQLELEGRIKPHELDDHEVLLESQDDPLAWRTQSMHGGGQLIVVGNGSFLLNYPLINKEHRKLAAQLVASVDPDGRVAFIESEGDGPPINEDPANKIPSALSMFTVWPINVLLLHLAALGVVLCVCWWPIFGRPKSPPRSDASDFGRHVDALGEMLELTGDHTYATMRVLQYQQSQRGEAAPASASHHTTTPTLTQLPTGQTASGSNPGAPSVAAESGHRGTPPMRGQL